MWIEFTESSEFICRNHIQMLLTQGWGFFLILFLMGDWREMVELLGGGLDDFYGSEGRMF